MGDVYVALGMGGGYSSDDVTVTRDKVLAGYTAVTADSDDEPITGTMPDRGTWAGSVGMNSRVEIPRGYHNGSGAVSGPSVTQRGAWGTTIGINGNVTIPQGYHNGSGKVTQSISTLGGQTITPSKSTQTVSCSGKYMTGNITIGAIPSNYINITGGSVLFNTAGAGMFSGIVIRIGIQSENYGWSNGFVSGSGFHFRILGKNGNNTYWHEIILRNSIDLTDVNLITLEYNANPSYSDARLLLFDANKISRGSGNRSTFKSTMNVSDKKGHFFIGLFMETGRSESGEDVRNGYIKSLTIS